MKKVILSLCALGFLSACQTTGSLRDGEVMGGDIGTILLEEADKRVSASDEEKMNAEIEKALYFSEDGLTTEWYIGFNARIRPTGKVRDRRDRDCRRFRHGVTIDRRWHNGTAVACREHNIPWYLISNRWDRRLDRDGPGDRGNHRDHGSWQNLSGELGGDPANQSNDDFGPRNSANW
ncbi:hypothetical protein RYZ26_05975 [Terasakiella sp. A23]|uniref:hypothetical protein n=1 Tax=Terasakiella sp. FCG-A23 TaxID=3080561 RepID=UPI002952EEFA|nr:hypothetical protein [Terasakiella sp. A23]MDV7339130.1 hypothetical protein [Terasakiella sp. A23]